MSNDIDETAANGRKNPENSKVDVTDILTNGGDNVNVDLGDRAKTYEIDLDAIADSFKDGETNAQLNFFGNAGSKGTEGRNTLELLKDIEATGDNKRTSDFVDDGGSKNKLELFEIEDGEVVASDDMMALVEAALLGDEEADLQFNATSDGFEILVGGRWSTDVLSFTGDMATDILAEIAEEHPTEVACALGERNVDLKDNKDSLGVYIFNDPDKIEKQHNGSDGSLDQSENAIGSILNGSFLNEKDGELEALIQAALDDKYGLGETKGLEYVSDDGESLVIKITNTNGPATDTLILKGSEIALLMDDYTGEFGTHLDTKDSKSQIALLDTDAVPDGQTTKIWFGGSNGKVHFDKDMTISLASIDAVGVRNDASNPNQLRSDTVDEFVFNVLKYDGMEDVSLVSGGEKFDDYMVVEMKSDQGQIETLILQGERVGDAIDYYHDTGMQYDFFA